ADGPKEPHQLRGSWWRYDKLILGAVSFDANRALRHSRHVRADQLDHYRLILKQTGILHCETNGVRQVIQPGEILLHDLAQPAEFDFGPGSNIILVVPREMLDEALPLPLDLHGARLHGPAARLLATHLQGLVAHSPQVTLAETPMLTQATVNLLVASILPSAPSLARASKDTETTRLRQMCRYIDLHLGEADLSADAIAQFFAVSRSNLYRIFEPMGGVANFIKERRLARVHELLSQPSKRLPIARLAEEHGFKSAAHFSRAFRERYGYSPNDLKHGSQSALGAGLKGEQRGDESATFYTWIRSLRD
ncbi:MAG: helix-turn-helix domain-containing protein, partial [Burkholderiaceae bacterium]